MKKILTGLFCWFLLFTFAFTDDLSPKRELVLQLGDSFPQLHPHLVYDSVSMQIATASYEGLFCNDPYNSFPVKALAKSYKLSGNTWRFELREDAKFSNADPITAETIRESWLSLLSPEADFPYASLLDCIQGALEYRTGKNKDPQSVAISVEGDYVLSLYMKEPTPHLPSILCNAAFAAVHPSQLQYAVKFNKKHTSVNAKNSFIPISSGPYKVKKYDDAGIVFEKNDMYWDKNSLKLEKLVLRFDLSEDELADAFNRGDLQWVKNANLSKLLGSQIINYSPMFASSFLFFNVADKNVANKKLRQALLFAVPYDEIRSSFYIKAKSLVFPLAGYPEVKGVDEYNVNQAKKIFNELKLSEKEKLISIKIYDYDFQKKLADTLKKAWEKIGFSVEIKTVAAGTDLQLNLKNNDYSISLMTWIADFADPLAMLELFRSGSTLNESNWSDKNFDAILSAANNESDGAKRYKKLAEAETYLLESYMLIPLGFNLSVNIIDSSEIDGWYPNALDIHPFKFLEYKQKVLAPGFI